MVRRIIQMFERMLPAALLALSISNAPAQILLTPAELPGIRTVRSDTVHGKALWGLIDGGADIYFEYGFSDVTAREMYWNGSRFKVEIYTMDSDEAAFGIFSVSRHKCKSDTLTGWCCESPFQIQFAKGKCYVSVVNDSGTPAEQELGRRSSAKILEKIDGEALKIPPLFNDPLFRPYLGNIKFVSGPLGIQNGYPSWEALFASIEKYRAYVLPFETGSGSTVVSAVRFSNPEDADRFLLNNPPSEREPPGSGTDRIKVPKKYFKKINSTEIIYLETDLPADYLIKYIQVIESSE